jgi:hypothetical protein
MSPIKMQKETSSYYSWWAVGVSFLIGAAIRVLSILFVSDLSGDALRRYHQIASNILLGNGFSRSTGPPFLPDNFDQPGYPLFVASFYSLFGEYQLPIYIAQVLLELAIIFIVILIVRELKLPKGIEKPVLSLGLIFPILPVFSGQLMTETVCTFFVSLACLFCIRTIHRNAWINSLIAGGLGAAAISTRADSIISVSLMFAAAASTIILRNDLDISAGRKKYRFLKFVLPAAIGLVIVLTPWTVRNFRVFGQFTPLGTIVAQTNFGYVRWLDTWLVNPKLLDPYWWSILSDNDPDGYAALHQPEDERSRAIALIREMKTSDQFESTSAGFEELARDARESRLIDARIFVPIKRLFFSLAYVPSYCEWGTSVKVAVFALWAVILVAAVVGSYFSFAYLGCQSLILLAWPLGRMLLPLLSSLAVEPRYQIESIPAILLLAAVGIYGLSETPPSKIVPAASEAP